MAFSHPDDQSFRPPLPSLRTRSWNRKTEFCCRESYVSPDDREVHCESGLEGKALLALLADPRVVRVVEQPPAVSYVDDRGVRRSHTVDLLATLRDGTRIAVLVKPKAKAARVDLERLIEMLRTQVPRSFADRWMHLDESHLRRDIVDRGQMILRVRLDGPFGDDPAVERVARVVDRPMRVADAVTAAGPAADLWAVVRLVADGHLQTPGSVRLDMDTTVAPAKEHVR